MTIRHFVDAAGHYLGGFGEGVLPPPASVEVATPPDSAE